MLGLPTETDEDVLGIAELGQKVVDWYYETPRTARRASAVGRHGQRGGVRAEAVHAVPVVRRRTPSKTAREKAEICVESIDISRKLTVNYHGAETSFLEAVFARGDRKLNAVLLEAHQPRPALRRLGGLLRFRRVDADLRRSRHRPRILRQPRSAALTRSSRGIISTTASKNHS